jgi:hypothetical protein
MMARSRGFSADATGFPRSAAHLVVAALVVTAVFTAPWIGVVANAGSARAQQIASASPAPVKYYVVPPTGSTQPDTLFAIALRTLGNGSRYMEIFNLNKGRLQPNGDRLERPGVIEAGWILQLPNDATGPGVHFGPLPVPTPKFTSPASPRPSQPGATPATAPASALRWLVAGSAIAVGLAVFAVIVAGLTVRSRRRRQAPITGSRMSISAGEPGPPVSRVSTSAAPGGAGNRPAVDDTGPRWPQVPTEATWQDWGPPPELHPDHPSAPVPRVRLPATRWESPAVPPGGASARTQQWPSQPTSAPGAGAPRHAEPVFGDSGPRAVLTENPVVWQGRPYAGTPAAGAVRVARHAARQADPVRWELAEVRNADPVWLAGRFLSVADAKAAEITQAASGQAAAIREAAERDAAEIRRLASEQAAAIREAAEWEAAEARTAVMTMSAELNRVASFVAENLASPSAPARQPQVRPARQPEIQPARQPELQPAGQPEARPRQYAAMRLTVAVMAALLLFAVAAGSTELVLHGYSFFVFRSAGTGATSDDGRQENQGPGQPDAPGARHHTRGAHHQIGRGPSTSGGGSNG